MATTYTANAGLQKPSTSDRNWDVPINANADALDAMTAIGGLAVTPVESPGATPKVRVAPGDYVRSDGTVASFPGAPGLDLPASSTSVLWLADGGDLGSGPSYPASAHLRLARVVTGPTSVLRVADGRVQCSVAGAGAGFVLKAGDTIAGPLTVADPGSATPLLVADPAGRRVAFFGAWPASQAPAVAPLSGPPGVASDALADVGPSFAQAVLNDNFASLAAKVDALIAALKRHGLMGS